LQKAVTENQVIYQVKRIYHELAFTGERKKLLQSQDSIFEGFLKSASLRYKTGETNLLEQATAQAQRNEIKNQLRRVDSDLAVLQGQLKSLLNTEYLLGISATFTGDLALQPDSSSVESNPSLAYARQQIEVSSREKKYESAKGAPELLVGFFSQTLVGTPKENGTLATASNRFTGFHVGVAIPLWFAPHQGRIKAAEFRKQADQKRYEQHQLSLQSEFAQAFQRYENNRNSLEYYRTSGLPNADLIMKQSQIAFKEGEIGYAEFLLGLRNALAIRENYLQTLNDYNQSIIYLEYLSGNK